MRYLVLLLAGFVLVMSMAYVIAGLDGTPEFIARIVQGLGIIAVGLTSRKASLHFRETRKEKAESTENG
jgi:hypothetical protein